MKSFSVGDLVSIPYRWNRKTPKPRIGLVVGKEAYSGRFMVLTNGKIFYYFLHELEEIS